jgi:membrane-bound acyltransferase YfiQ involved in biofilm formation
MDCPRCKLVNPDTALRCDCGYDFESKAVKQPYFKQELPKGIHHFLIFLLVWNVLWVFVSGAVFTMAAFPAVFWMGIEYWCYTNLVRKKNWARIALIVVTFPIGLVLLGSEARLYCMQPEV